MSRKATFIANWLLDAENLVPGDQLEIYLSDERVSPPSYQDMRDALHAQFGKDTLIRIYKHGQRISIFIHPDEESRKRFDHRSSAMVVRKGDGREEIENGFVRNL